MFQKVILRDGISLILAEIILIILITGDTLFLVWFYTYDNLFSLYHLHAINDE